VLKTKKLLIVLTILNLLFISSLPVMAADTLLSVSCDMFLGIRLGLESRFNNNRGVKADVGAAFYGLLLADAFYVIYLLPEDHRYRLNILLGMPTAAAPMTLEAAMVSFGASLAGGYRFTDNFSMDFRLGAGFPLFFEPGKDVIRPIRILCFIPYLWPDIVLGFNFTLPCSL